MRQHAIERLAAYAEGGGKLVLVGDAGKFCADQPGERDLLARRVGKLGNVRRIDDPSKEPPPPGPVSRARYAFGAKEIDALLAWADVKRRVSVTNPQFECVRKRSEDGRRVYVAVFRRWPGHYNNVWYDEQVKQRWGQESTEVVVPGLSGRWRIEKFHRTEKSLGTVAATDGSVRFETDPAFAGELQLFRLTARN